MFANIDELNSVADQYRMIEERVSPGGFDIPLNLRECSAAVDDAYRRGTHFDPVFRYRLPVDSDLDLVSDLAEVVRAVGGPWAEPLRESVEYMKHTLAEATNRDPEATTARTTVMFGRVDEQLVQESREVLELPFDAPGEDSALNAHFMAEVFQSVLRFAGLRVWTVSVSDHMSAMMSVSAESRSVLVREGSMFSRTLALRLVAHEIGCHVLRAASGQEQPLHFLGYGLGVGYTSTEEGLAAYQEQLTGLSDPVDERRFALRYLAADLALQNGFGHVYNELRKYASHEQAFETVARAKRGITETASAGCHLKDKSYFEGLKAMSSHLQSRPQDLETLYLGKFSLKLLPEVERALSRGDLHPASFTHQMVPALVAHADAFMANRNVPDRPLEA